MHQPKKCKALYPKKKRGGAGFSEKKITKIFNYFMRNLLFNDDFDLYILNTKYWVIFIK